MSILSIPNLRIQEITDDIFLVHQIKASALFTNCDGLIVLPKKNRNDKTILIDLNLEVEHIKQISEVISPISDYICSHTHLDHSSHVHAWEDLGAKIHAPFPEYDHLLGHEILLRKFGFLDYLDMSIGESFIKYNGYKRCRHVEPFTPGTYLKFDDFIIETIHLPGHSFGHVGFFLPEEKIFHISCLGFDQHEPNIDGFGPWYGFRTNSLEQYEKDIDLAEKIFLEKACFLTSSHSYIVKHPDTTPFDYMRRRIKYNQKVVDDAIRSLKTLPKTIDELVDILLELDLFFPKHKMRGFLLEIYKVWESWFIRKHLERNKEIKFYSSLG
ncbi:MAG: MBL fold metallo-hydrolase [Candidatus Lokiarchaeota archaeon]|nr:MBL fold metallo-hydrolase [Candidatus Lokiarchaeota archaeon]